MTERQSEKQLRLSRVRSGERPRLQALKLGRSCKELQSACKMRWHSGLFLNEEALIARVPLYRCSLAAMWSTPPRHVRYQHRLLPGSAPRLAAAGWGAS